MGFSVSGSLVVVLMGLFVALGAFYASGANATERLAAAEGDQAEHFDRAHETELAVTSVTLTGSCGVEVRANNTGSTTLSLNDTSLLLENAVQTGWRDGAEVDGDASTWLWAPGQQLVVTRTGLSSAPDGVSVVSKTGVTSRHNTEGLVC